MSNITQFFGSGGVERKKNRRIFHSSNSNVGIITTTGVEWPVPPGVTEVEVHCWGAGGDGSLLPTQVCGGGGGGGYVTHVFPVSPTDKLLITCGVSPSGTSSVSVPTQSPISPISATGGSIGTSVTGGSGGVGSYTIAPGISTSRTFKADGGNGGSVTAPPGLPGSCGGGGSAGSLFGKGATPLSAGAFQGIGGAGIGGYGTSYGGGGSLGNAGPYFSGMGKNGYKEVYTYASPVNAAIAENSSGIDDWFYVDEILGSGGTPTSRHGGPGSGGGSPNGNGGILGGGGGPGGNGGLAGGGAGLGRGGAGLVILYW